MDPRDETHRRNKFELERRTRVLAGRNSNNPVNESGRVLIKQKEELERQVADCDRLPEAGQATPAVGLKPAKESAAERSIEPTDLTLKLRTPLKQSDERLSPQSRDGGDVADSNARRKGDPLLLGEKIAVSFRTAEKYLGITERHRQKLIRRGSLDVQGQGHNRQITTDSLKKYLPPKIPN